MKTYTPIQLKKKLKLHALWLVDDPNGVRADLSFANLSFANLSFADLSYANLSSANLSHADLSYANLSFADLRSANLSFANLSFADLSHADLSYANLSSANLSHADLSYANLSFADLQQIRGAIFASCTWGLHGECGRQLSAVVVNDESRYFCGCFQGTIAELREYIANGETKYAASRTLAADFIEARIQEQIDHNANQAKI